MGCRTQTQAVKATGAQQPRSASALHSVRPHCAQQGSTSPNTQPRVIFPRVTGSPFSEYSVKTSRMPCMTMKKAEPMARTGHPSSVSGQWSNAGLQSSAYFMTSSPGSSSRTMTRCESSSRSLSSSKLKDTGFLSLRTCRTFFRCSSASSIASFFCLLFLALL